MGHKIIDSIPENVEYIWKSNIPNLTVTKLKIGGKIEHEQGISFIHVDEEGNELKGNRVLCAKNTNGEGWLVKNAIHFTEKDAAKRIAPKIRVVIEGTCSEYETVDMDLLKKNYLYFCDTYPECVI